MQVNFSLKASQLAPGAWWMVGLALAVCSGIASNSITLVGIQVLAIAIILLAREEAPWSRSLRFYIFTAALVIVIRLAFRIVFNFDSPDHIALNLPAFRISFGALGDINLLGRVSQFSLSTALRDGLRMSAIILSIGLANSLANPRRLLKATPSALYGVTSAFVIALNLAPQLISSAKRIRQASQLRNDSNRASNPLLLISPILEDSIDRSMALAASMDARGFGRRGNLTSAQLQISRFSLLVAVSALASGAYLLLATDFIAASLISFGLGISAIFGSLRIASVANLRTRYVLRPWQFKDSVIAAMSIALVLLFVTGAIR